MSSLLARSTGIRSPRASRADETPSPVVSEGFQSDIVEQQQEEQQHGRKRDDILRQRRPAGYRAANPNLNVNANTHANSVSAGRMSTVSSRRRGGGGRARGAQRMAAATTKTKTKTKEVVEGWRPAQRMRRDSTLKAFPTESTRDGWLTNDPKNIEETGETVVMVGDSGRHHPELAKLYGFSVGEEGKVLDDDGRVIGRVVDGKPEGLIGQTVDENGEILDENEDLIGRVDVMRDDDGKEGDGERGEFRELEGLRVNKQGNVIGTDGVLVARVLGQGHAVAVGREVGKDGRIRDCNGTVMADVELIAADERMYAIVRQMRDAISPLRQEMKLANRFPTVTLVGKTVVNDMKPLVDDARQALQECDRALRAHCPDNDNGIDQPLADMINEFGESVLETINNACQITADSQNTYYIHPLVIMIVEPPLRIAVTIALKVIRFYAGILNTVGIGKILRMVLRRFGIYKRLEEFGLSAVIEVLERGSGK